MRSVESMAQRAREVRFCQGLFFSFILASTTAALTWQVKVVLLGDTGVGKSSLVLRFITNEFKPYVESTIGASFMSRLILVDGAPIKFQVSACSA